MTIFSFANPIDLPGTNGKAVLLMHGWSGNPDDMRYLATELNKVGYTVKVPRFSGHGTTAEDFVKANWHSWVYEADKAYNELLHKFNAEDVYVAGLSMGGCVATILAERYSNIPKVALFAPAFIAKDKLIYITPFLSPFVKYWEKKDNLRTSTDPERQAFLDVYENKTWVEPSADLLGVQLNSRWNLSKVTKAAVKVWLAKDDEAVDQAIVPYITARIKQATFSRPETGHHVIVDREERELVARETIAFFQ